MSHSDVLHSGANGPEGGIDGVEKKHGDTPEPGKANRNAAALPELREFDSEKGHMKAETPHLRRTLKSRDIAFIGLGSGIGVGVFVGIGSALANAGPAGLLMANIIVGALVWGVMQSIGNFPQYVARFVDPAMGLAMGWNYWWLYAISIASELSAAALVISYWSPVSAGVWITVCFIPMIIVNFLPVKVFGDIEVATSSLKVITIIGLLLLGLIIDLGGVPGQERIGFRYWRDPGAFVQFTGAAGPIAGASGRFLAFFTAFINAGYSYSGTEVVVIAASEG